MKFSRLIRKFVESDLVRQIIKWRLSRLQLICLGYTEHKRGQAMGDEQKDGFDINFGLLPPQLRMRLWILGLDADTSKVNIAYQNSVFRSYLAYSYGGNVEAGLAVRRFSSQLGVNPGNGDIDLGLSFRGFRFGASASFATGAYGAGLGYGAKLLPFPAELSSTFNSAAGGLHSMAGNISAAPDNPLAWYEMHSNDVGAISDAVSAGKRIAGQSPDQPFGFGMRLNYHPEGGLTIYGGVQWLFF